MPAFTCAWWVAAGRRAAYTALAALLPLAALLAAGDVTAGFAASVAAAAALLSLTWSLKGLPEVDGTAVPMWRAIIARVLKTAAEVALPALSAATVLQDVSWRELVVTIGGAALATLVRTAMTYLGAGLPEDTSPAPVTPDGVHVVTDLHSEVDATPPPPGHEPRHRAGT